MALAASHDLRLLSQAEQHTQKDSSANASGEVGISIGSTTGIYLSAAGGLSRAHGNGETHTDSLVGDGQRIGRLPEVGQNGIDDLLKVNRPDVDYGVVEYKFGSSKLGDTLDGKQLSDSWSTGAVTGNDRILKSVSDTMLAESIQNSLESGRVERWVVHTDTYGKVSVGVVDSNGKFIPDPQGASKILGANSEA